MKHLIHFIAAALLVVAVSCGNAGNRDNLPLVSIKTDFGEIKVRLYSETPEHTNNFIKLAGEGYYNDLLFHRVINHFMIQGGDPESKNAEPGKRLGGGSPDYTLKAEFMPEEYFHKKGALAAARTGGPSNPEKRSSGSQFYIVQGEVFTSGKLDTLEMKKNAQLKNEMIQQIFEAAQDELNAFREKNDKAGFDIRVAELRAQADSAFEVSPTKFKFTDEQRKTYTTIGGYPSLDGEYTVFGEVVEGLDVLDKIAAVQTDPYNRPLKDVKMKVELLK
ncbi:MAG: peptidylprolyl isomerase [Bacteroidia bacterium]|nr:peptidylprolyl isomerase [Bacteroidia bacterium]